MRHISLTCYKSNTKDGSSQCYDTQLSDNLDEFTEHLPTLNSTFKKANNTINQWQISRDKFSARCICKSILALEITDSISCRFFVTSITTSEKKKSC